MRGGAAALTATALILCACKPAQPAATPKNEPAASKTAGATPTPAPTPTWIEWNADEDGSPHAFPAGPFRVTVTKAQTPDDLFQPVLTVSDGKGADLTLRGAEGSMSSAQAEFMAAALDRQATGSQLLLRTFTYGAHCCFAYQLAERRGQAWVVHDLGQYDGTGMPEPQDVDGDGRLELVGGDQRFLYAFAAYAFSAVPPQVLEVVGGKTIDVSADPRYRAAFESDAAKSRQACQERPEPGICLAYAATMARLNRLDEAWPLVEAADPTARGQDGGPDDCWGGRTYCVGDRKIAVKSFREKVERFLADNGYLPRTVAR